MSAQEIKPVKPLAVRPDARRERQSQDVKSQDDSAGYGDKRNDKHECYDECRVCAARDCPQTFGITTTRGVRGASRLLAQHHRNHVTLLFFISVARGLQNHVARRHYVY
jgi:hypothetical protein